jgi:hypothetical protein
MNTEQASLLEELFKITHDDQLFHEFLNEIFKKNLTCLLHGLGGKELETKFDSCLREFFVSLTNTMKLAQVSSPFADLEIEFGKLNDEHLVLSSEDCFPTLTSLKSFPGYRKCVKYANSSLTRSLILVCLLPEHARTYSFISDGFLPTPPYQNLNFESRTRPQALVKTLQKCAVSCTVSSDISCSVLLVVCDSIEKTVFARSRIGVKGCAHAALALHTDREYIVYPFSSTASACLTLTVGSLSGRNSCEFH